MTMRGPLCMLALAAVLSGCNDKKPPPPAPRPVLSMVVSTQKERSYVFTGTVEPRYRVSLGFRVAGRMNARNVNVGDFIKTGQQVAAIEPQALEYNVRSAIAAVSAARAQYANAAGAEQRQSTLVRQDVVPQAQYGAAPLSQQTSGSDVRSAEASLAKASEQLTYAKLLSEMDGVVTAVDAQVGQVVQIGQSIATIARPDVREAAVDVPEDVAALLQPGTPFEIALQLDPSVRTQGKVREVGPQADAATRTRRILITLPEAREVFRLGTTITAILRIPQTPVMEIPRTALLQKDGKDIVWIFDAGTQTVSARPVTVAALSGDMVQVSEGLSDGMRVVTAGTHSLREGLKVRLPDPTGR